MTATRTFLAKLVKAWPALPYLSLGAWFASIYIASSGTAWLSDTEVDGANLSSLYIYASLAAGVVLLAATFAAPRVREALRRPRTAIAAGVLAAAGNALVIAIGPYYLTAYLPAEAIYALFRVGGFCLGAGLGVIALRCAQLYGALPPRQVIAYVAFSQVLVACAFFIVVGSPSWGPVSGGPALAGIVAFVGLPLLAGCMASLSRYSDETVPVSGRVVTRSALPRSFWKLLAVVFVFSCIVSSVYASVVAVSPIGTTLDGSRLVMVVRMLLAAALACVAVGTEGDKLNFGKAYSIVMVASVAGLMIHISCGELLPTALEEEGKEHPVRPMLWLAAGILFVMAMEG